MELNENQKLHDFNHIIIYEKYYELILMKKIILFKNNIQLKRKYQINYINFII